MKKFLPYILILVVLVGFFSPVSQLIASQDDPTEPCVAPEGININEPCGRLPASQPNLTIPAGSPGGASITVPTDKGVLGGLFSISSFASAEIFAPVLGWLAYVIMQLTSLLMGLSGLILNFVINHTIVDMAKNITGMTGINIAWKVIRDLMNIAFIFLLVYEGIKMIIGQGDVKKLQSFVSGIVLASLLINFSLFFTKVIIDASNIVTIGVYNSIISDTTGSETGTSSQVGNNRGLSNAFSQSLGLQGIFSGDSIGGLQYSGKDDYGILVVGLMSSVLFIITAFVFFAISVMFVVRYLVLILLLALSPIAYMGMALPGIKKQSDEWWSTLWGQIIFAPIYMLMTWVVLILINSDGFLGINGAILDKTKWTAFANSADPKSSVELFFNFALVIGLTIASLVTAKKYATQGASQIGKFTSQATTFAGNTLMGGSAAIARRTVGAGASRIAESQGFQNWAGRSFVGEKLLNTTRRVGSGSLDIRRSKIGEDVAERIGVDFGKGVPFNEKAGQGGFTQTVQEKAKARQDYAGTLRGNPAKEAYASRIARGMFTRGGSNSSGNTIFGTLGRSNRVVASKILNDQLTPLETAEQNLQNRESQLSQQAASMANEITTLTASGANPARLAALTAPAYQPAPAGSPPGTNGPANRSSLAYIQDQLANTQTRLTNTTTEATRIRDAITANGLVNTDGAPVPGQATPGQTRRLAQLNAQLVVINRIIAARGAAGPTPADTAILTRINAQLAGLNTAIAATIAATAVPGNPALGVRNAQTGGIRGRRADEQNF